MTSLGPRRTRYTTVAITLHWLIAALIVTIATLGLIMVNVKLAPIWQFRLYQWHKSIGITILLLAMVRLVWRLAYPAPPLPAEMPRLERQAASSAHWVLYGLMLGLPLVGWALVSASPYNIPTVLYGVIPWPHLPVLPGLSNKAAVEHVLKGVHAYGAFVLIGVVVLHAAAALRHHLVIRDDVLRRMIPGLPQSGAPQPKRSR